MNNYCNSTHTAIENHDLNFEKVNTLKQAGTDKRLGWFDGTCSQHMSRWWEDALRHEVADR